MLQLLEAAGIGMQAGGQIYGGLVGRQEGKDQQKIAKYNQAVMYMRAKAIREKAQFDQQRQAEAGARLMSQQKAAAGASGAMITEGAPLLAAAKQRSELDLENLMIGYEGELAAQEAISQGEEYRMQGAMARKRGENALLGAFLEAGGTVLKGFGQMNWPAPSTPSAAARASWTAPSRGAFGIT